MRLFIAINLPPALRHELWQASAPLREAGLPVRWVGESEIHLTLKFLGPATEAQVPGLVSAIQGAVDGTKPFVLPISGFGAFPSVERPRIFWVGCDGVPPLELLQHGLELGTERLGFPVEARPFRPHLTLGRAKKEASTKSLGDVGALLEGVDYQGECLVESVDLMESKLSSRGSKYRVVQAVSLGPVTDK